MNETQAFLEIEVLKLQLPPPIKQRYCSAPQYKLLKLQDASFAPKLCDTPGAVFDFWQSQIATAAWLEPEKEHFLVCFLNTRRYLTGFNLVAVGTLDTITVHAREVFRPAIVAGAAAVILVHNHPSGDPAPSQGDIVTTRNLMRAGELLKIEVLDHVVIGAPNRQPAFCSLRELGYLAI